MRLYVIGYVTKALLEWMKKVLVSRKKKKLPIIDIVLLEINVVARVQMGNEEDYVRSSCSCICGTYGTLVLSVGTG